MPKELKQVNFELSQCRKLRPGTVLLINHLHARGVDFRAVNGSGVDLLIASGTPHDRFLVQLCGRVGRYGQPCERFVLKGITERISENEERDIRTAVHDRVTKL